MPTTGKPTADSSMSATEALSYFEGYNDAIKSCADVEKAALVKRVCDLELQVDLPSRLRALSSAVMRAAELRISGLSRGVDELFAVKRSEAILAVAAKDLLFTRAGLITKCSSLTIL